MRILAVLALPLALAGCWTGPDFYAGRPSVQPIEPGRYKVVRVFAMFPDAEQRLINEPVGARLDIAYGKDGSVILESRPSSFPEADARLVELDAERGLYIVQVDMAQGTEVMDRSVYGLVMLQPDGYRLSVPPCDGTRRLRPGSPVVVRGLLFGLKCVYKDRASFEAAMLEFADDPSSWTEYRRVVLRG